MAQNYSSLPWEIQPNNKVFTTAYYRFLRVQSNTSEIISMAAFGVTQRTDERRLDVRYVGPINGCYTLSRHRDIETGGIEVFACRTQSISAAAAAILAPVPGAPGEAVTARFDGVGIVQGSVDRLTKDGFVFQIAASDEDRAKLAAKIDWLKQKSVRKQEEHRAHKRFQPRDPRSTIRLASGEVLRCFVIDLSRSGAAVSCQHAPEIGERLTLATLACHVVRRLRVGFAVQFEIAQEGEGFEQLITGFEPTAG